jgi:hypothetical protein
MKSIYFLLYFTRKGARHGIYAGAFARKTASPKNPKGLSSGQGDGPITDHLHVLVVLSSSRSTPENKKSSENSKVCPRHPPRTNAPSASLTRASRCHDALSIHGSQGSPHLRKAEHGGASRRVDALSIRRSQDSPRSRKAKHSRIIEDQGRSDHLEKETQIRRSTLGP